MTAAFWVDEEQVSRSRSYVRRYAELIAGEVEDFDDDGDRRVAFAAAVWPVVRPPVMAPGYVRCHPRVLSDQVLHDGGALVASVELATPWPAELAVSRRWRGATQWRGWPVVRHAGGTVFVPPSEMETTAAHLTASARLDFPLPPSTVLPTPPRELTPFRTVEAAALTVTTLVTVLNQVVSPVVAVLEGSQACPYPYSPEGGDPR